MLRVPIAALQASLVLRPYVWRLRSIRNIILAGAYFTCYIRILCTLCLHLTRVFSTETGLCLCEIRGVMLPSSGALRRSSPTRVYSVDTGSFLLRVKQWGHEADHSTLSSTEGENECILTCNLRTGAT
jgi:hypothetical protein